MKKTQRNHYEALHHVIEVECLPALRVLAEICEKEERITQEIKKQPSTKKGFGNLITLKRALVCLLCVRVANIFDDKRGISCKDFGMKLDKDKLIRKMIRTRHTWFGHIGKDTNDIISGQEIVDSDLENKLQNLSAKLTSKYFL